MAPQQHNVMNREPIFWTTTSPGYNTSDRERTVMYDDVHPVTGKVTKKRGVEKFPQRGHLGDYEDRRTAPGERWMLVVRHDGHEVRAPLTNGAAHMDSATGFGQYVRTKARALGWYDPRQCPCALLAIGMLQAEHIHSDEVRTARPCTRTGREKDRCEHSLAEQKARQLNQRQIQDDREEAFQTKEDKMLEMMKMQIDAQNKQTAAIVDRMNAIDIPPTEPKKK